MKNKISYMTVAATLLCFAQSASAITIDGAFGLSEWAGNYSAEDGVGPGGYVGPGVGGQSFDVEYLGLRIKNGTVYFGLQTGFNLASGVKQGGIQYNPGDFAIDINNDGFYEYAIDYGITSGIPSYKLYAVSAWQNSMYAQHHVSDPFQYSSGTFIPTAFNGAYGHGVFPNNSDGGNSYVLEGSFGLNALAAYTGGPVTLHWTMSCGNDYLNVTTTPAPEPSTLLLLGSGIAGAAWWSARRRKKA